MAKLRNRITPDFKTLIRRPSTYLMALLFIAMLSSPFNFNEDIEQTGIEATNEAMDQMQIDETEMAPAPEQEEVEEIEAEKAEEVEEKNQSLRTNTFSQNVASPKLESAQSVTDLSSAVAYKAVKLNVAKFSGELSWTSAFQKNIKHFEIERSMDDEHYEKIGSIAGEGLGEFNKDISYSFEDTSLMYIQIPRIYYRIRQVGLDGKKGYGDVIEFDTELEIGFYGNVS